MFPSYFFKTISVDLKKVNLSLLSSNSKNISFKQEIQHFNKLLKKSPSDPDLLLLRGILNMETGENEQQALCDFDTIISIDSEYFDAHICRAYLLFRDRENREIIFKSISELSQKYPDNAQLLFCLGDLYRREKEYDKALEYLQKGSQYEPTAKVFRNIGLIHRTLKFYKLAISSFSRSLSLELDLETLLIRGDLFREIGDYYKALDDYKSALPLAHNKARVIRREAQLLHLKLNKFDAAVQKYEELIRINPKDHDALYNIGYITYFKYKKYDSAMEQFEKAIEIYSRCAAYYHFYALLLNKKERYDEALDNIDKGIQCNPKHYRLLCNRAVTLWKMGDLNAALQGFNKALPLSQNDPLGFFFKGKLLEEMGKYEKALSTYSQGISLSNGDRFLYEARSDFYRNIHHSPIKALNDITAAIECDSARTDLLIKRSYLHEEAYLDYYESARDISRALELEPKNPAVLYRSAEYYYECGQYEHYPRAISQISLAIEQEPINWNYHFLRGKLYYSIGEYEKSETELQNCIENSHDELIIDESIELIDAMTEFTV